MTRVIHREDGTRIVIIASEDEEKCEECGEIAELRPYGENFKKICYECMKKDEVACTQRMNRLLFGDEK